MSRRSRSVSLSEHGRKKRSTRPGPDRYATCRERPQRSFASAAVTFLAAVAHDGVQYRSVSSSVAIWKEKAWLCFECRGAVEAEARHAEDSELPVRTSPFFAWDIAGSLGDGGHFAIGDVAAQNWEMSSVFLKPEAEFLFWRHVHVFDVH